MLCYLVEGTLLIFSMVVFPVSDSSSVIVVLVLLSEVIFSVDSSSESSKINCKLTNSSSMTGTVVSLCLLLLMAVDSALEILLGVSMVVVLSIIHCVSVIEFVSIVSVVFGRIFVSVGESSVRTSVM